MPKIGLFAAGEKRGKKEEEKKLKADKTGDATNIFYYQEHFSYRYARGEALERETNLNRTFCAAFNADKKYKCSQRPGGRRDWTRVTAGCTSHGGGTGPQGRRWKPVQGAYRCSEDSLRGCKVSRGRRWRPERSVYRRYHACGHRLVPCPRRAYKITKTFAYNQCITE